MDSLMDTTGSQKSVQQFVESCKTHQISFEEHASLVLATLQAAELIIHIAIVSSIFAPLTCTVSSSKQQNKIDSVRSMTSSCTSNNF